MTAAGEAIATLEKRAAFDFFLHDYRIPTAPTPRSFPLLETIGIFGHADGTSLLVRIAGGVELRTALRHLNAGDIRPLREVVLRSRPRPDALSWRLPLTGWRLPHDNHFSGSRPEPHAGPANPDPAEKGPGCAVVTQSYVLEKALPAEAGGDGGQKRFFGFPPPPPPPPSLLPIGGRPPGVRSPGPLEAGGVEIAIEPEGQPADLEAERKRVLGGRPSDDSLAWPIEDPGKEKR
ncbi:MAG: hypothetical protein HYY20_05620 [Candidatus Tectomicrobia bacterium]|uniref:Uncharacterized protein n=1 Tax=Tectimicrobiota bacterium TaxID=2528274 RepID=A0A932FWI0_UNCTE|nr:hypothetical protein [Candidatus Tectomicrobia bacterium]